MTQPSCSLSGCIQEFNQGLHTQSTMAAKKRSTTGHNRKRSRTSDSGGGNDRTPNEPRKSRQDHINRGAQSQLKYGAVILVAAILGGVLWNKFDSVDPGVRAFLSEACRKTASCGRFVIPTRRTLQTGRTIRAGETLVEIPRSMQFWDLDALRDSFVKQHLLGARHARTKNVVARGAFLAAWLSLQIKEKEHETDSVRKAYLEMLPSIDDISQHPVLRDKEELASLGIHSLAFAVAMNYKEMVESEYEAFTKASTAFADKVNETEYKAARIHVLSRSFSPGPVGEDEGLGNEEYESYLNELGFDFKKGSHAMVPILDLLNHHPNPNVLYNYNKEKRAFVITAKTTIPSGWELMDSYGTYTDNHLFGKFGFVNGDGSGGTQASIALFHRMMDFSRKKEFSHIPHEGKNMALERDQRSDLRRYLQFDDGYSYCIEDPEKHPDEYKLKRLKMEYLVKIANDARFWVITLPARMPNSHPVESSDISITDAPPQIDPKSIQMNFSPLVDTCRLLSLTTKDYDGHAIDFLANNLSNPKFVIEHDNEALEYRAIKW